jgi:glycerophosphoryl diester phosphodiesterase
VIRDVGSPAQDSMALSSARTRPLLLGHRGARPLSRFRIGVVRDKVPAENTIACFEYALAHGCDGFEFDIRTTADNHLVLCHDALIRGRSVVASSFESLCSANTSSLACLEEVLRVFGDRAYLNIEVKVAGAERAIAAALAQFPPQCGYLISSFLAEVLLRLQQVDSSLPLGYVCQRSASLPLWRELPVQVVLPHYKLIARELITEVHDRGLQIFTWTVNRESVLRRFGDWGIDGVISDDPGLLAQTFPRTAVPAKS